MPRLLFKDMNDNITVIQENPLGIASAFNADRPYPRSRNSCSIWSAIALTCGIFAPEQITK